MTHPPFRAIAERPGYPEIESRAPVYPPLSNRQTPRACHRVTPPAHQTVHIGNSAAGEPETALMQLQRVFAEKCKSRGRLPPARAFRSQSRRVVRAIAAADPAAGRPPNRHRLSISVA